MSDENPVRARYLANNEARDRYDQWLISQIRFGPARRDAERAYRRDRVWWGRLLRRIGR